MLEFYINKVGKNLKIVWKILYDFEKLSISSEYYFYMPGDSFSCRDICTFPKTIFFRDP